MYRYKLFLSSILMKAVLNTPSKSYLRDSEFINICSNFVLINSSWIFSLLSLIKSFNLTSSLFSISFFTNKNFARSGLISSYEKIKSASISLFVKYKHIFSIMFLISLFSMSNIALFLFKLKSKKGVITFE